MIFVDSGAWYASIIPADVNHDAAKHWLDRNTEPLLTTDYVIDETLTLLRIRGYTASAIELGEMLLGGGVALVVPVTDDDFNRAWHTFRTFDDKQWSFTDCTSKAVMERLQIQKAFAFDQHFRQFGTVAVVP